MGRMNAFRMDFGTSVWVLDTFDVYLTGTNRNQGIVESANNPLHCILNAKSSRMGMIHPVLTDIPKNHIITVNDRSGNVRVIVLPYREDSVGTKIFRNQPIAELANLKRQLLTKTTEMMEFVSRSKLPSFAQFEEFAKGIYESARARQETLKPSMSPAQRMALGFQNEGEL